MKKRWLLVAAIAAAGVPAGIAFIESNAQTGSRAPLPILPTAPTSGERPPVSVVVSGAEAIQVSSRMKANPQVGNDVIFLIMASLRRRCYPELAHSLPRMAVIAHLPVLSPGDDGNIYSEELMHEISHTVADVVQRASCKQPLALQIGSYSSVLNLEAYADDFPESYFAPPLVEASREPHTATLEQREADSCTAVVYAKLPLDDAHAWQCTGPRRSARITILHLCHAEDSWPKRAASDIQHVIDEMPLTCQ